MDYNSSDFLYYYVNYKLNTHKFVLVNRIYKLYTMIRPLIFINDCSILSLMTFLEVYTLL